MWPFTYHRELFSLVYLPLPVVTDVNRFDADGINDTSWLVGFLFTTLPQQFPAPSRVSLLVQ